jgi:hypothetical protein
MRIDEVTRKVEACREKGRRQHGENEREFQDVHPGHFGIIAQVRRYAARLRITLMRSDLPSKPMPGSSGMTMWPSSTRTPSGKPP